MQCVKCSVFPSLACRFSEGGQGVTKSQVPGTHGKFRTLPKGTSSILTLTRVSAWEAQGCRVCSNSHRLAEFPSNSTSDMFSFYRLRHQNSTNGLFSEVCTFIKLILEGRPSKTGIKLPRQKLHEGYSFFSPVFIFIFIIPTSIL